MSRVAFCSLVLFGVATVRPAAAQTDSADARQLFEDGRALAKQGRYSEACPKFEVSNQRNHGIGTSFNLADCWEHLGKLASAWAMFRDVADEAARANQLDREAVALQRAEALRPRLSYLVLRVAADEPGLEVRRNGVTGLTSDRDRPVPLDPGEYQLEATAPGKQPWVGAVVVPASGQTVEVTVPALVANAPSRRPIGATQSSTSLGEMAPREPTDHPGKGQRIGAYLAAGGGAVAIGVGAIFGLRVLSKSDRANSICPSGHGCTSQDITDYERAVSDAKQARTTASIAFSVGGAALLTGVVLYFTAPGPRATSPATGRLRLETVANPLSARHWAPFLAPGMAGTAWQTRF
ncbi:MAG TPA: hypothetical protein VIV60_28640 [Polyangiaceae bacterium]